MKILGISGALRKASTNTGMLRELARISADPVTFDIATLHGIPLYNEDDEVLTGKPSSVADLADRIRQADGIVIATPEYNFSVPGVLKNATDWVSRGGSPFKWKRVGIIGAGAGEFAGTARAQYHLRQNLQSLNAIVMPRPEVFVPHNELKFDGSGNVTSDAVKDRLKSWFEAFLEWVEKRP